MHETDNKTGWRDMKDMRDAKSDQGIIDPETRILHSLERCFKVADELAELTMGIEERLGFVLFSSLESPEPATAGSLEADTSPAPMIGRLNDLERHLRRTRNHLSDTSNRIAI